ncbi:hypothetical protein NE237_003198 [Protea cynaroides]|uniref:Uncharacterized protein n=1 Tax=Protea cynaroides TaxID=273540 RepID=A0A9Q0KGK9_9MAGN|nr:hypothetical protein NE237_003198 [Protea cynaroides]
MEGDRRFQYISNWNPFKLNGSEERERGRMKREKAESSLDGLRLEFEICQPVVRLGWFCTNPAQSGRIAPPAVLANVVLGGKFGCSMKANCVLKLGFLAAIEE